MDSHKLSQILQGEKKFRFQQVNKAVYKDFIQSWEELTVLSKDLRSRLQAECPLDTKAQIFKSKDGSQKALLEFADGSIVETVLMDQKGKLSVCLSSQAGCPLGCTFCATGQNGFQRNLDADEIVEQFLFWARLLKKEGKEKRIDNVVFMGMGEPFLNYDNFIKSVRLLNDPEKIALGARHISVSTAGLVPGIKKLASEKIQINLAISLHAANDSLRSRLMPVAKTYPLESLFKAVDYYIQKTGRKVMFEYLMLKNINDDEDDARSLAQLLRKPLYFLNLIPYNNTGAFQASSPAKMRFFKEELENLGVAVSIRKSQGQDITAACGQLAGKKKENK